MLYRPAIGEKKNVSFPYNFNNIKSSYLYDMQFNVNIILTSIFIEGYL